MRIVTNDRTSYARLRLASRAPHVQRCASFDPAPCFVRCPTRDMEIALHSHAHCSPPQTFKTNE
ncbi:hypothetical protein HR51_28340 [Burkholderia cepacia]|nr:hypothetical protein HR51_28340 [Burkholderia cepacia]